MADARPTRSVEDTRLPVVDLVRLLSILLVLVTHLAGVALAVPIQDPDLKDAWRHVTRNGVYGVSLFFVVSGYVISRSLARHVEDLSTLSLRSFYVRRVARILPMFFLTVLVGVVAMTLLPATPAVASCLRSPRGIFDTAFWASLFTFSFNWLRISRDHVAPSFGLHWDILWSLAVEEQFYLVYPWALRRLKTRSHGLAALSAVVVLGAVARSVSIALDPDSFLLTFTNSFVCFDLLAMGALLHFVLERLPPARHALEPLLGLVALATAVSVYTFTFLGDPQDRAWAPTVLGLSVAVFLGVGIRANWCSSDVARAVVYPGNLSYGAYLFHPLVLLLAWDALGGQPWFVALPLFAALTFGLAHVLHVLFEKPMRQAIRARLDVTAGSGS